MTPTPNRYNLSQALLGLGEGELKRKGSQRGTVSLRGGEWYIIFREFVIDDTGNVKWRQTSKLIEQAPGERLTKRQAKERGYHDHVAKANGLTMTPGASATVQQFLDNKWRPDYIEQQAKGTRGQVESLLKCHILPSLGHCQLREVNRAMVQTLITGKARSGLATQTVAHIRNIISMIFDHARRLNFFAGEIPTTDLLINTVEHAEVRPLTFAEVAMVKDHLTEERMQALVDLLAHLGLRISEAAGLRWCCVNLGDEIQWVDGFAIPPLSIFIREQYCRNEWKKLKTIGSKAVIPLTSDVWVPLSEWFLRSKFTGPMDAVFAGRNGKAFDAHNEAKRRLKPAAVKAGLPFVSWHSFRHTASTRADQALTMREKMDLLRHKSVGVHMSYTASNIDTIRQKLELMNTPKTRH